MQDSIPAIVDKDLFEEVQQKIKMCIRDSHRAVPLQVWDKLAA